MKLSMSTRFWLAWQVIRGTFVEARWDRTSHGERAQITFDRSNEFQRRWTRGRS